MRSANSIKNAIIAIITNMLTIFIGFFAQKVFIHTLGNEYLGINSLFNNILSMLSIIELGIGSAIIYNLYKPIAENDKEKIKSLMLFYKISYRIIALIVFILGVCLIPFLKNIVGEIQIHESIILIYLLFLCDTVVSYLLSYKRSVLYANQKTYITNVVHIAYIVLMNLCQIVILYTTKNFILYLLVKIVFRILENVVITLIANKSFPYLKEKNVEKISNELKRNIKIKVKGLMYHKIGGYVVLGTDNIIISKFFGIVTVGLYSNYNLIINAVNNLFSQVFSSITASVGNLLICNDENKSYQTFRRMLFLNSWIYAFVTAGILCIIEPFIILWIGEQYLLKRMVLIVLVINCYIQGMRKTSNTFKEAAGIFYQDRYVPLVESIINIIASIIFLKLFGLSGVFMGTITSSLILFFYSYPIYVYEPLFKRKYVNFILEHLYYLIITIFSVSITYIIINTIVIENVLVQLIVNTVIVVIVPNLIYFLIFRKKDEFIYYKDIVKNILNKINNKKNEKS